MLKALFKDRLHSKAILFPLLMLFGMWFGFLLQNQGFFESCKGAIIPLLPEGLIGVVLSPFLHGGFEHIFSNSIPIAVLMFLLFQFYPTSATKVFLFSWLFSGLLTWVLPPIDIFTGQYRYVCIIGASGLVYALAFFLFFSGVIRKDKKLLTISLLVALYYGSLIWGVLPEELFNTLSEPSKISWQAHLSGAIAGIVLAVMFRKQGEKQKKFIWEFPNYYNEKDDQLWQHYIQNHPDDFHEMPQKKKDNIWDTLMNCAKNNLNCLSLRKSGVCFLRNISIPLLCEDAVLLAIFGF